MLQIGSTGRYKSKDFELIGRMRTWFEESVFNYWTVKFSDDSCGMLFEGYGLYAMLFTQALQNDNRSHEKLSHFEPGDIKKWESRFQVQKNQITIMCEHDGELLFSAKPYRARIIDFSSPAGQLITVMEINDDKVYAYQAFVVSFNELELKNLRNYDFEKKKFPCKNCNNHVVVLTFPYAQSCACENCRTFYAADSGINFQSTKQVGSSDVTPALPLNSKGIIKDTEYVVVGFAVKEESNKYAARWREYTLFNPQKGFAFLSEFNGHWIYLRQRLDSPVLTNRLTSKFVYADENFMLFNAYSHKVVHAAGEFPYNIFDNEETQIREFISPPEIWIEEKNVREGIIWYNGEYVKEAEVRKAFNLETLPTRYGIGAVQPTGYISFDKLLLAFLIGAVILAAIHLGITSGNAQRVLLARTMDFPDGKTSVSYVTPRFALDKRNSNIKFDISAPVNNSWFELNATLVNSETGTEYNIEQGVEYYYGYSDGENWSEGSNSEEAWLTSIPRGNYYLQINGIRESTVFADGLPFFSVTATYDVPMRSNLLFSLLLLLLWPLGRFLLDNYYYEKQRWADSPYSPYNE